jgi:hypothetical protein
LLDGLSEQPAGHSASVSDPGRGVISGNAISLGNKLLPTFHWDLNADGAGKIAFLGAFPWIARNI